MVEYTGTFRLDVCCIMRDAAAKEAKARAMWEAIAKKLPEIMESDYDGLQVTSSEIKIFVRDIE